MAVPVEVGGGEAVGPGRRVDSQPRKPARVRVEADRESGAGFEDVFEAVAVEVPGNEGASTAVHVSARVGRGRARRGAGGGFPQPHPFQALGKTLSDAGSGGRRGSRQRVNRYALDQARAEPRGLDTVGHPDGGWGAGRLGGRGGGQRQADPELEQAHAPPRGRSARSATTIRFDPSRQSTHGSPRIRVELHARAGPAVRTPFPAAA